MGVELKLVYVCGFDCSVGLLRRVDFPRDVCCDAEPDRHKRNENVRMKQTPGKSAASAPQHHSSQRQSLWTHSSNTTFGDIRSETNCHGAHSQNEQACVYEGLGNATTQMQPTKK
jgi:hypothetical protein